MTKSRPPDPLALRRFLREPSSDPSAPTRRPEEGGERTVLGKYRLLREIGRGGMAVVYEAEDPDLGRRVALKVLRSDKEDPELVTRLHREAVLAGRLCSPNIIGIHEVGTIRDGAGDAPLHYIAMDCIEGGTLKQVLPGLSRPKRLAVLETVAATMGRAHREGVVHRDLKPENILMAEPGRPVITDFGLARGETVPTRLTASFARVGTPRYMSPEQARGRTRSITSRSDVWALGVILYEMLTDRLPFESENVLDLFADILDRVPPAPRTVRSSIPRELETICLKCLEKNPAHRYPSAAELAEDLKRSRDGQTILARRPGALERAGRWLARRRVWLGAAGLTGVLLVTAWLAFSTISKTRELERIRGEARRAHAAGNWAAAKSLCDQGLRLRFDPELRGIASDSVVRMADEDRSAREKEDLRLFDERLSVYRGAVQEVRDSLYIRANSEHSRVEKLGTLLPEFERFAGAHSHQVEAWKWLGVGRYFWGDLDRAEAALREAAGIDPRDGTVAVTLARIDLERALGLLLIYPGESAPEKMALAVPFLERAIATLERPLAGEERDREIYAAVARGYLAYASRNPEEAKRIADSNYRRLQDSVGAEEFWLLCTWLYPADWLERMRVFDRALLLRPHFPWLELRYGATTASKDPRGALRSLESARTCHPRFAEAHAFAGFAWLDAGDLDRAKQAFDDALRLKPSFAFAHHGRAKLLGEGSDWSGAVGALNEAIRLSPKNAQYFHSRAHALSQLQRTDDAIRDYSESIHLDPKAVSAYFHRALLRSSKGDWSGAVEDYEIALQRAPAKWAERAEAEKALEAARKHAAPRSK